MGSKKDLRAELEVLRKELSSTQLKLSFSQSAVDYWVGAAAAWLDRMTELEAELRTERAKPPLYLASANPADKKIIENQKATILELNNRVDELGRNCDGWKCSVRHLAKDNIALVDEKRQLKDELAELKAKPSMPFPPDSYKIASLEKEIRSLNLYITRLEGNLSDVRKLVN